MSFITDKQTLDDLNIFATAGRNCVYALFNKTFTRGGAQILEEMFRYPLSDADKINKRAGTIAYFMQRGQPFPYKSEWFDAVEHYLTDTDERSRLTAHGNSPARWLKKRLGADAQFDFVHKGVLATLHVLHQTAKFLAEMEKSQSEYSASDETAAMRKIMSDPKIVELLKTPVPRNMPHEKLAKVDQLLRYEKITLLRKLLSRIYTMDVYMSVAKVATEKRFATAQAFPPERNVLNMTDAYHPLLKNAVANTLHTGARQNVVFLTGANMAGKSTFMKTFGIVAYLAHVGLPVPAKSVEFSVRSGLYTTINLPDNLSMGHSHFYAEVLRLKKIAQQIRRTKNLIVVFDELFRGTNVKDAYDATLAITDAFAQNTHSIYVVSTHITEAGEALRERTQNVRYVYLPTLIKQGEMPSYTYLLTEGISNDRHGMMIVHNEKIIEMLENGAKNNNAQKENL